MTQAQFAGYYAAVAKGYYRQAWLNVKIKVGQTADSYEKCVIPAVNAVREMGFTSGRFGFNPLIDFYENSLPIFGHMFGARWSDSAGRSALAADPAWARLLRWQKELIDWYGYEDLVRFVADVGQEFTPANAFQMGKLAMNIDGEWRVAFLATEAPHLDFGTAPYPVDDAAPDLYGSGYINGSVIGIPTGAGYLEESWKLVRYLATDDRALANRDAAETIFRDGSVPSRVQAVIED